MEDLVEKYTKELTMCLTGGLEINTRSNLIKKHTVNLNKSGDFSFPLKLEAWLPCLGEHYDNAENSMLGDNFNHTKFLCATEKCSIPVKNFVFALDRINVFLDRTQAYSHGFRNFFTHEDSYKLLTNDIQFEDLFQEVSDLTVLRERIIKNAVKNYLFAIESEEEIVITSKSHSGANVGLLCGPVLNLETGQKELLVNSSKLFEQRNTEVEMQARHKFGQRPNSQWTQLLSDITKSVICFEFLQIKPSSALKLDFKPGSSSARSAAFIEYNCARIEKLLNTFNDRVKDGYYPPLVQIEDLDFSVLNEENEWRLFFNYVMPFQHNFGDARLDFAPHVMCAYVSSLVREFSVYYKKTAILRENRNHLIPSIHARIYLLLAIGKVLKACMKILNMKIISQM